MPRAGMPTPVTAFSFSPMMRTYVNEDLMSEPAAVMRPMERTPPALHPLAKASGYCTSILRTSASGIFWLPLPTPMAQKPTVAPASLATGSTASASLSMSGTTTSRTLGMSPNSSVRLRFTTATCLTAGLAASRFTICRPTFPVEPSTTAEEGAGLLTSLPAPPRSGGGPQQVGVAEHGGVEHVCLVGCLCPIPSLHRFRETGKLQVSIGVAGSIENVLKPGPPGNARRVEPVGLHLKELVIEASNLSLGGISSGEVVECQFAELLAGGLEVGDTILELLQRQHIGIDLVVVLQLGEKAPQRRAIGPKVEWQDVRVCEPQRHQTPDARHGDVISKSRITDAGHPEVIVVGRMIYAVVAGKPEVDYGSSQMIQKHRVVGAAADSRLDQIGISGRGREFLAPHRCSAPRLVQ